MNARASRERVLRARLAALARMLPAARRGEVNGIHKARVATRRLREALPIVLAHRPGRKTARLRRRYRKLTRALGPVRELDVTLGLLEPLRSPATADALSWLEQELARERARRFKGLAEALDHVRIRKLAERALALAETGAGAQRIAALRSARRLGRRVERRARALREAVASAGALYAPEPLHAVRIAVKQLRYALELAFDMGALRSRRPILRLKAAQEILGELHDVQVLLDRTRHAQGRLPRALRHLGTDLSGLADTLEDRCRERHAIYLAQRAALVEAVVGAARRRHGRPEGEDRSLRG